MNRAALWRGVKAGAGLLAALTLVAAAPPSKTTQPRRDTPLEAALRSHVETLASDEFDGREPGTDGETLTLRYLARQWFDIGLESGTNNPGNPWFAPVELVEREPVLSRAVFMRGKRRIVLPPDSVFVVTSGLRSLVQDAPVLFVGHATGPVPPRSELAGRIVLMLDSLPTGTDPASVVDRPGRLLDGGAAAVITLLDGDRGIEDIIARRRRAGYALAGERIGNDIEAFVTRGIAAQLLAGGAHPDVATLRKDADSPRFTPYSLGITGSLEAASRETRIKTHNLIGKLEGRMPEAGAVLVLAHWDHFGTCAEAPAEDLVCNGAVDNASGLAVMTETARILSRGRQMDRDVYFLATTGEELGLLGALAFAENPPLPLDMIVAAFNIDSTGLVPAGRPVAIVGKGLTGLDPLIEATARRMKRRMAAGDAANAYIRRQDSWVLIQHDVPAVMVSSSYSDMERLERFMEDTYHRPGDDLRQPIEYGGMADDVALQVELVRSFADVKRFPAPVQIGGRTPARTP